jgi:signal transduction histidine kinase
MRLLPASLFGRLALTVLGILVLALLASLGLHLHERGELLMQASGMRAAQRVSDIVQLFDTVAPEDRRRIAKVLSAPPLYVTLDGPAVLAASDDEEGAARSALFTAMLRRFIGEERALRARVSAAATPSARGDWPPGMMMKKGWGPIEGGPPPGPLYRGQPGMALTAQVQLQDGSWVTIENRQPVQLANWPYRLLWSIGILLAAAIATALIAVRWAIRPLDTLANAAEELGRNVNRPPLPETGPIEVARAARAFNTMQGRLIEFLRSRTQLLAAMSHDLKTPITRLRLRSELLDDPKLRDRYGQDLAELEAMVGSTLEFLRGIDDKEPARPIDVMAMLESLQADLQETGANVTLAGEGAGAYVGQRSALRRCLANLLDNAIKYGGSAHVVVADAPDALLVCVQDEGPGIAADQLDKVFEPFYRIEGSRSRETGGTGLGLAIARQIARAHGGDVTLANRPEGGLEARLRLPRVKSAEHD